MNGRLGEVRGSDRSDGLLVSPLDADDGNQLVLALRALLPGASITRRPGGAWVPASHADKLVAAGTALGLQWDDAARTFAANRALAKRFHLPLRKRIQDLVKGGRAAAEELLADVPGLEPLDDHQWVNVAAMTLADGFGLCVFDEQGAGKTVTVIFAFDVLVERDEADFALIVAPKSMVPEWPQDFARFKGDLYDIRVVAGDRRSKARSIRSGADVLVTNYETVVSMESELRTRLQRHRGRSVLVVDESFYVKSLDAQRTRTVRRLREWCARAFVLCGTPAPNAPPDLVQQFDIVDFGTTFGEIDVPEDRTEASRVVRRVMARRGLYVRNLKRDVLPGLPEKRFQRLFIPLQPHQRRLYEAALHSLVIDLKGVDEREFGRHLSSFLARRSTLLQLCSNPAAVAPGYAEVPAKLLALDGVLDELVGRHREKVVLWSYYTASISAIVERYQRYGPVRYDGTVADVELRRLAVRRFQEDNETMLFVANPAAAGAGLTLHRARHAVYESMSNQAAHYLQSLDRIHRRGQERLVQYLVLLCEGTLEVQEHDRLTVKERAAQELLGDEVEVRLTRDVMLEEALAAARALQELP